VQLNEFSEADIQCLLYPSAGPQKSEILCYKQASALKVRLKIEKTQPLFLVLQASKWAWQ
jgi:hypothetical protein